MWFGLRLWNRMREVGDRYRGRRRDSCVEVEAV